MHLAGEDGEAPAIVPSQFRIAEARHRQPTVRPTTSRVQATGQFWARHLPGSLGTPFGFVLQRPQTAQIRENLPDSVAEPELATQRADVPDRT